MKVSSHTRNLALSVPYILKYARSYHVTDIHIVVHFSVVNWPRNSVWKGLMNLLVHAEPCVIFTSPHPPPHHIYWCSSMFNARCCTVEVHTWGHFHVYFSPLNAELNSVYHLLALLGAHHILHVSRIRINWFKQIFAVTRWTLSFWNKYYTVSLQWKSCFCSRRIILTIFYKQLRGLVKLFLYSQIHVFVHKNIFKIWLKIHMWHWLLWRKFSVKGMWDFSFHW
jgi:hypothetical protein